MPLDMLYMSIFSLSTLLFAFILVSPAMLPTWITNDINKVRTLSYLSIFVAFSSIIALFKTKNLI